MPVSVTLPTPLGEELHPPAWCHLVARQLSYHLQPSLTEAPLAFQALGGLPAGYRRQAGEKVLLQT